MTPRVVVLSLLLAVALGYLVPVIDYKIFNTFLGATHLPPGALGVLLVLVLVVNPLLRLLSVAFKNTRLALSRNEALTVYITCLFSSLLPGHGAENFVIPNLIAPFYFASRENKWLEFLEPQLRPWMTPALWAERSNTYSDAGRVAVGGWYEALRAGQSIPWDAWLVPLCAWGALVLAVYVMLGCLSIMLRAQWAENEALAFPLLRLPLALTQDLDRREGQAGQAARFFHNPIMWAGFGIAVFIQTMRGLNLYYPEVPTVPLDINMGPLLSAPPWNQIGWVPVTVYPIVVGVTYLLTSEVSFSLWFFFWFIKLQLVGAYYLGYVPGTLPDASSALPGKLFTGYQMQGAYYAYVAIVMWTARQHFKHVIRRAFGRIKAGEGEATEALSYPAAFWGFVGAFAFLMGWSLLAGVRVDVALALWVSYLVLAIGLTRVAVEGGMLFLLHDSFPLGSIARLFSSSSSSWLAGGGVVPAAMIQSGIVFHLRGFAMPSFVQSFKLAHDHKIAPRPLTALLIAVILLSVTTSFFTVVHLGYDNGGLLLGHRWFAQQGSLSPANFVKNMEKMTNNSPVTNWISMGVGAVLTYGMMLARSRFAGFPFHPIGYLMCLTYSGFMFWFSIFLGWLAKGIITRFGGHETYRKTTPFFLGLALGDVAMILLWLAIDGWQGRTGHQLMPG